MKRNRGFFRRFVFGARGIQIEIWWHALGSGLRSHNNICYLQNKIISHKTTKHRKMLGISCQICRLTLLKSVIWFFSQFFDSKNTVFQSQFLSIFEKRNKFSFANEPNAGSNPTPFSLSNILFSPAKSSSSCVYGTAFLYLFFFGFLLRGLAFFGLVYAFLWLYFWNVGEFMALQILN